MSFPYDSSDREPFFISTLKIFLNLFESPNTAVRIHSIIYGFVLFLLILFLGRKIFNLSAALIAISFFAINPTIGFYTISGNRLTAFSFWLLIFYFILFHYKGRKKYLFLGISGGLLALIRLSSIFIVISSFLIYILIKRENFRIIGFAFLIFLLLVSPYLVYQYIEFGNPLHSTYKHARFWANYEFAGTKNFPALSEIKNNSYIGGELSPSQYIFGMHDFSDVLLRYLKNYYLAFNRYLKHSFRHIVWAFYLGLTGMIYLLFEKRRWIILYIFIILFPFVFILNLDPLGGEKGVEVRFIMHIFPFFILSLGYFIQRMSEIGRTCISSLITS